MIDAIASTAGGNLPVLAMAIVTYTAGVFTPGRYAGERLEGFGRVVASKLPYQPPPGKQEEEALQEATDADE